MFAYFVGSRGAIARGCAIGAPLLVALAACSPAYLQQRTDEPQNAADTVRSADLTPRFPTAVRQSSGGDIKGGGFLAFGTESAGAVAEGDATSQASPDAPAESAEGYTLNFDNSPLANVAKVVLGDILGLRREEGPSH